jgi:hypothetical protein
VGDREAEGFSGLHREVHDSFFVARESVQVSSFYSFFHIS